MSKQDIKKLLTKQRKALTKDTKRYMDVLREDFSSQVKTIGEQYDSIMNKLKDHDKRFDSHDKRFDSIEEKLDSHDKRFDSHDKRFDSHDKRFDSIEEKLDSHTEMIASMKEDIEIMKVDISFIKGSLKQKVDVEEFEALEKRVAHLEAKIK